MIAARNYAVLLIAAFALAACASVPAPRNLQESLAYGYSTVASARLTSASLLDSGVITVAEARQVRDTANRARAGLDAAMTALDVGNAGGAEQQLALVGSALSQLEAFLRKRKE